MFKSVVGGYVEAKKMPPICATNSDDENRNRKLGPLTIHFLVDVELATEAALKDRPDLQRAWFELAQDHPVEPAVAKETIHRCGAMYTARGLMPKQYFTFIKRRKGEPLPR